MKKQNVGGLQLFISGGVYFLISGAVFAIPEKLRPEIPEQYFVWILFSACAILALTVYFGVHYIPAKIAVPLGACGWIAIPVAVLIITTWKNWAEPNNSRMNIPGARNPNFTEPNQALQRTNVLVTDHAPSSMLRAKHVRRWALTFGRFIGIVLYYWNWRIKVGDLFFMV